MAERNCDCPDPEQALKPILDTMESIRNIAEQSLNVGQQALAEAQNTNGRVRGLERELYGPTDRRDMHMGRGLLDDIEEMKRAVNKLDTTATAMTAGQAGSRYSWQVVVGGAGLLLTLLMLGISVLALAMP